MGLCLGALYSRFSIAKDRGRRTGSSTVGFFILCLFLASAFHSSSGCCWDLFVFWAFCKQRLLLIAKDGDLFQAFRIKAFRGWYPDVSMLRWRRFMKLSMQV